jgi:hypothetical protein
VKYRYTVTYTGTVEAAHTTDAKIAALEASSEPEWWPDVEVEPVYEQEGEEEE